MEGVPFREGRHDRQDRGVRRDLSRAAWGGPSLTLGTMLDRPGLLIGVVERPQLIKALDRSAELPVTLVSAPAGFGKAVLVSQ